MNWSLWKWMAGIDIGKAMSMLWTVSLMVKLTVISSFNGRVITIGLDRHG